MERKNCVVIKNVEIAKDIFKMVLSCHDLGMQKAGQFINITVDGFYLRRPISVCDYENDSITIIYKKLGEGTKAMGKIASGTIIDCLIGLGNGFDIEKATKNTLLIGGGVGVPPLYLLAKSLINKGIIPKVLLGFNTLSDAILVKEFKALGCETYVTTIDGSMGHKGFVTELLDNLDYDYFYACGPLAMLKAVSKETKTSGQISMEERMGCGFGACMGCSIMTKNGAKRVCKEGPVFLKEELIW